SRFGASGKGGAIQVDLRVLVDEVFNRGRAELGELFGRDFGDRARCGEGLTLDARTGDRDGVQAGRLRRGLLRLLRKRRAGTGERDRAYCKREHECVPQLVALQSHLSLHVSIRETSPERSIQPPKPARSNRSYLAPFIN